jgi:hypothetical protein
MLAGDGPGQAERPLWLVGRPLRLPIVGATASGLLGMNQPIPGFRPQLERAYHAPTFVILSRRSAAKELSDGTRGVHRTPPGELARSLTLLRRFENA